MSCHVPPDACYVVCDMDAAHTRGHGKIHILTEDRCFASDRQQYRAQAGEFFLVTFSCLKRTVHLSEKIGRNFHPVKKLFFNWGRNNSRKHCWKTNMTLKIGNASSCIVDFPASPVSFRFLYWKSRNGKSSEAKPPFLGFHVNFPWRTNFFQKRNQVETVAAQDHFVKLVGFRLQEMYGIPMELWLGRVRPCLLPRPRRFAGLVAQAAY